MSDVLLSVEDLRVHFRTDAGIVHAVDGVTFDVQRGETLAIVGESGCGKSVTAMSILGLVPSPPATIAGAVRFEGEDLLGASPARLRAIRGDAIAMVFQEPMTSLNPVYTVGDQIGESFRVHRGLSPEEARSEALRMLEVVRIPNPRGRLDEYPHQLSGGMRQRVMIAMALACDPVLLIADEPTTALDVTVQAQILDLLVDLQERRGLSILLITHDLGVVAEMAHRTAVMYAGLIVERAPVVDLFERPRHPYTAGLFDSLPRLDGPDEPLRPIAGNVPDGLTFPTGCRFNPRCPHAFDVCTTHAPALVPRHTGPGHVSACWYVDEHPRADLRRAASSAEEPG